MATFTFASAGLAAVLAIQGFQSKIEISKIDFSPAGLQCRECGRAGINLHQDIAFQPSGWNPLYFCTDTRMNFRVKATDYFSGPGHITIGVNGEITPQSSQSPGRLSGRGIVLGQTAGYPNSRGCADGPRVQIESYWPYDLAVPSELSLPYPAQPGNKGNELFPESCSSKKLADRESYSISIAVNCRREVRYAMVSAQTPCEERLVVDRSLDGALPISVNTTTARNVSGWWLGHVFAPQIASWRIEVSNLTVEKETYLTLPSFIHLRRRSGVKPLCEAAKT